MRRAAAAVLAGPAAAQPVPLPAGATPLLELAATYGFRAVTCSG